MSAQTTVQSGRRVAGSFCSACLNRPHPLCFLPWLGWNVFRHSRRSWTSSQSYQWSSENDFKEKRKPRPQSFRLIPTTPKNQQILEDLYQAASTVSFVKGWKYQQGKKMCTWTKKKWNRLLTEPCCYCLETILHLIEPWQRLRAILS